MANNSPNTEDFGYTYDRAWNLQYRTNSGSVNPFIVDGKNELTNAFGATYAYDESGNLVSGTNGHTAYVYDDENRLVQWFWFAQDAADCTNGALRTDFFYDGIGRLRVRVEYAIPVAASTNPPPQAGPLMQQPPPCPWQLVSETHYIYDGSRVIQERDGNNTPLVSYTRGNDLSGTLEGAGGIGGLLARSVGYSGGNWTSHACYHADGNGNITCLIDSSQSAVARYRYDPFGNTVLKLGALADANVYRFSSKELHLASGMYYYLYRFYDPNLQRWVNRDPIGEEGFEVLRNDQVDSSAGGVNLFRFVRNAPIGSCDAFGLYSIPGADSDSQRLKCYTCQEITISGRLCITNVIFEQCFGIANRDTPINQKAFDDCARSLEELFAYNCSLGNTKPLASIVRRLQNCYRHHW